MKHFDIIGDVHGQAGKLERLFRVSGYEKIGGVYGLAGHKAVFVGDLIDRGLRSEKRSRSSRLWSMQLAASALWVTMNLTHWRFIPRMALAPTFGSTLRRWSFSRLGPAQRNIT
jgi:hypothetical protein